MKKILIILATLFAFVSCDEETLRYYEEKAARRAAIEMEEKALSREVDLSSSFTSEIKVKLFQYKGHDMVMVLYGIGDASIGGVFHDPECRKCKGHFPIEEDSTPVEENLSDYEKVFGKSNY